MTRALVVILLLASAPAAAEPPRDQRYGTQILIADLVAWAAVTPFFISQDHTTRTLAVSGLVAYLHVPPAIHAFHGNWGEALLDYLPLRFAAPIIAYDLAGCTFLGGSPHSDGCDPPRAIAASLVTIVAVQAFDALVLARKRTERRTGPYLLPASNGVTLHWAF